MGAHEDKGARVKGSVHETVRKTAEAAASWQECVRLGQFVPQNGVDLAFAGIGENGRSAFSDPPAELANDDDTDLDRQLPRAAGPRGMVQQGGAGNSHNRDDPGHSEVEIYRGRRSKGTKSRSRPMRSYRRRQAGAPGIRLGRASADIPLSGRGGGIPAGPGDHPTIPPGEAETTRAMMNRPCRIA